MALGLFGDQVAAAEEHRRAVYHDPENGIAWCMLAASCLFRTQLDAQLAEAAAREAIRADPTWTYSYQMLGKSLMLQERYAEAVMPLSEALFTTLTTAFARPGGCPNESRTRVHSQRCMP